ncbi:MAG: PIG-L family deacetylase, partial [Clostridia bacterium]|nr:PIG-L family deacetylase [Clostridia bacterium]
PEETAALRHQEALDAGRCLGATHFHFLDHGDGTLEAVLPLSVEIASVIRKVQPQAIFAPDPWLNYECHLDHQITGKAAANAFLMAGRGHFPDGGATQPCRLSAIGFYFTSKPNTVVDITDTFDKKFQAMALHRSQLDAQTLGLYRVWFGMMGQELAAGKGFPIGEGLKVLSPLHAHCFVKAETI